MNQSTELLIALYNKMQDKKALNESLRNYLTNEIIEDLKRQKKQISDELKEEKRQIEDKEECKKMRFMIQECEENIAELSNKLYALSENLPEKIDTPSGEIRVDVKILKHIFLDNKEIKNRAYQLKLL